MFIIAKKKIIIKNKKENDINLMTNKERVFHQLSKPINQNIKGEINP